MISFHVHPTCGWNLHFSNLKITLALLVQLESHFAKRLEKYPIARARAWNCNRTKRLLLWVSTAGWLFLATLQPFWKRTETWREKVDLKHNPFKSRAKAKLWYEYFSFSGRFKLENLFVFNLLSQNINKYFAITFVHVTNIVCQHQCRKQWNAHTNLQSFSRNLCPRGC